MVIYFYEIEVGIWPAFGTAGRTETILLEIILLLRIVFMGKRSFCTKYIVTELKS